MVCVQSWLPSRAHVKEALDQRLDIDPSGESLESVICEDVGLHVASSRLAAAMPGGGTLLAGLD